MVVNDIAQRGLIKPHVKMLRRVYGERMVTMLDALTEFWPEGSSWTRPQGGLFLWARTPAECNTAEMSATAITHKVAYVPGAEFYPHSDGGFNAMRLNFSCMQPDMIIEGIRRLGDMIRDDLVRRRSKV
jgi:2-aminoadipate transaminase